jgi:hypothetical protein
MSLQDELENFVEAYAPREPWLRTMFIDALRKLMNQYAQNALLHGAVPEVGNPHGSGRKQ